MTRGREKPMAQPVIRRAPFMELKIFEITEAELDRLAKGSSASIHLNFALFLLPIALTLFVSLATTTIGSIRLFAAFVSVGTITLVLGILLLVLWRREHVSSRELVEEIRSRMPPPSAQDAPGIPKDAP